MILKSVDGGKTWKPTFIDLADPENIAKMRDAGMIDSRTDLGGASGPQSPQISSNHTEHQMTESDQKAQRDHAERMRNAWRDPQPATRADAAPATLGGKLENAEQRAKREMEEYNRNRSRNDAPACAPASAPQQKPATLVMVKADPEAPAGESESEKARRENAEWQRGRSRIDSIQRDQIRYGEPTPLGAVSK